MCGSQGGGSVCVLRLGYITYEIFISGPSGVVELIAFRAPGIHTSAISMHTRSFRERYAIDP